MFKQQLVTRWGVAIEDFIIIIPTILLAREVIETRPKLTSQSQFLRHRCETRLSINNVSLFNALPIARSRGHIKLNHRSSKVAPIATPRFPTNIAW